MRRHSWSLAIHIGLDSGLLCCLADCAVSLCRYILPRAIALVPINGRSLGRCVPLLAFMVDVARSELSALWLSDGVTVLEICNKKPASEGWCLWCYALSLPPTLLRDHFTLCSSIYWNTHFTWRLAKLKAPLVLHQDECNHSAAHKACNGYSSCPNVLFNVLPKLFRKHVVLPSSTAVLTCPCTNE